MKTTNPAKPTPDPSPFDMTASGLDRTLVKEAMEALFSVPPKLIIGESGIDMIKWEGIISFESPPQTLSVLHHVGWLQLAWGELVSGRRSEIMPAYSHYILGADGRVVTNIGGGDLIDLLTCDQHWRQLHCPQSEGPVRNREVIEKI